MIAIVKITTPAPESQPEIVSKKVSTLSRPVPAKESVGIKAARPKPCNLDLKLFFGEWGIKLAVAAPPPENTARLFHTETP